jgi:hypothetical protein
MLRRLLTSLALSFAFVGLAGTAALAADVPFGAGVDPGIPGWFVAFGALVVALGVAGTIWRMSLARQMAEEAGLDPDRAATMTLMSEDGLDATYLASSLRGDARTAPSPPPGPRSAQERLRELQQLRDEGLVTAEEYESRRTAIVDSI